MNKSCSKDVVLVTGANRGMGLAYVKYYLKKGYCVLATHKSLSNVEALFTYQKDYSDYLKIIEMDVADEQSIFALGQWLKSEKIKLSLVINNAGISQEEGFGKWTKNTFIDHFQVNAVGPALVSQEVLPFMRKDSKIIQVSSGMGSLKWNINPENGLDAYAASKSALHSITVRLAEKVKSKNIGVFLINPGWVKTQMGGKEATYSIEEAVANIAHIIQSLTLEQTGSFVSEKGISIPW